MPRLFAALAACVLGGLVPAPAQTIPSMGQPPRWQPYVAPAFMSGSRDQQSGAALFVGVHRPITNPVTGLFGVAGEAFVAPAPYDDSRIDPGVRLLATSRVIGLAAGAGWNARTHGTDVLLSFQTAIRRGGLLGRGTMLRVDWMPARDAVSLGLHVPVFQPFAGRTRNRYTVAALPDLPGARLPAGALPRPMELALTSIADASAAILAYTDLFPDQGPAPSYGQSYRAAVDMYHQAIVRLFGDSVAAFARKNVLDAVLLPYDRLFGQVKEDAIDVLTSSAQARFVTLLRDSLRVPASRTAELTVAHARWMRILRDAHDRLLRQWNDSRLVWLPLQLALVDADYDEQAEVDALVERAAGKRFTDENALTYLRSSDLPIEIARSIFAARDYHVLWMHDVTGRRDQTREIDNVSYTMVADAYLPALTRAVQRYDSAGKIPAYMIMLDQFYYESRSGRIWMSILENPLHARITLPRGEGNAERETHLRARQAELRAAVSASRAALPASLVKVHVNIVSPSDFSFRTRRIMPGWPFMADNVQRDHRKLVFYDLTEADPYRGALLVTGVGVGEHYASATWEDRGYRMRGPAALEARDAARRALERNGLRDIPAPLRAARPDSTPRDSLRRRAQTDYVGRAILVDNEVGFGPKSSSVARAALYNLAPPGSVIIVPDPLWVSHSWAAMLAGAAARGCRVYIISPSQANGPNPQPPVRAIQNDVMSRLLALQGRLHAQIERTGGELRIGLFTARAPITDVAGRLREVREGVARAPWIRELFPFDSATLAVLNRAESNTRASAQDATRMATDERPRAPQLHQKTQLIARPGAIGALLRQRGWEDVVARSIETQSGETAKFADQLGFRTPDVDTLATRSTDAIFTGYERSLSQAERRAVSFYFSLGSQNMDPRGLMQDGEASVVVSGVHAAAGFVDLYYLMARSTWIERKQELDRLVPEPRGLMQWLGRIMRALL
jgi:hypothetical protein